MVNNDAARVSQMLAQAMQLQKAGRFEPAEQLYAQVLDIQPGQFDALYFSGLIAMLGGNHQRAVRFLDSAIEVRPGFAPAYNHRGMALAALKQFDAAVASYDGAVAIKPDYAEAHCNRGTALASINKLDAAIASFDLAIANSPDFASAHFNRGVALTDLRQFEAAVASYDRVIAIQPDFAAAHFNKGVALAALGQPEAAIASYDRAIAVKADYAIAHNNKGIALAELRRHDAAIASFDRVIAIKPDFADAHSCRGCALHEMHLFDAAIASFDKAVAIDPDHADAWYNRGRTTAKARNFAEAIRSYENLLRIRPEFPFAAGMLLFTKMMCCEWNGFDEACASIRAALRAGKGCADPFGYQGVSESEEDLLKCAGIFATSEFPPPTALPPRIPAGDAKRITVGYLCGEFRDQATSVLMCGVYESHDKERFRLIGFDNGWDDGGRYRKRINRAFDEMIDIRRISDLGVAQLVREKNVDVLVNLNGYFGEPRLGVFAYRPSPLQVNYLGFPGTIGVDYIDYLIADRIVIPEPSRCHYAEKIVYLPDSYQANDRQRQVSDRAMNRAEFGLPDDAFVYCCFNNTYKITPSTFDTWMRILKQVPDSVLWMLDENVWSTANLAKEAARRGVEEKRLVFSRRLPLPEHLARHRLADLFLDTSPYNAHTTASDALWAGLPMLTRTGTTFPGRVGTSLLTAIGLPELVTTTRQQYESLAVELALSPQKLQAIREKLAGNRLTQPLFDTQLFTRHLESAYGMMFDRCCAGLAPEHFAVGESH